MYYLKYTIFLLLITLKQSLSEEPNQIITVEDTKYEANWDSLDLRPLPKWFDEAKIGIFLHWGVFSVPSFGSEWFWNNWKSNVSNYVEFMKRNYPPDISYQDFAKEFTAEFFDPKKWARLFDLSGAKYVVLTSKHHEGYTLWPSKYSYSWNSKDVGPHRDLVGELANAIRENTKLKFGLYHSLYEWYNPLYLDDRNHSFLQRTFSEGKVIPEMKELINLYKPSILWSDGDWEAPDTYWKSTDFLAWLYNESPVKDEIVTNDRWGRDIPCHHGDFYTCTDRYNPGVLQKHKWENAMTIDTKSWGYRRNADLSEYMSIKKLIRTLAETVSCGGNLNMNIGPTKEGTIAPIFQERLTQMGVWLGFNGEAIYGSRPWIIQNDTIADVWYTSKDNVVYAILLTWPSNGTVTLGSASSLLKNSNCRVYLMGCVELNELKWSRNGTNVDISMPNYSKFNFLKWAWVLKIKH